MHQLLVALGPCIHHFTVIPLSNLVFTFFGLSAFRILFHRVTPSFLQIKILQLRNKSRGKKKPFTGLISVEAFLLLFGGFLGGGVCNLRVKIGGHYLKIYLIITSFSP